MEGLDDGFFEESLKNIQAAYVQVQWLDITQRYKQ